MYLVGLVWDSDQHWGGEKSLQYSIMFPDLMGSVCFLLACVGVADFWCYGPNKLPTSCYWFW